MFGRPKIAMVVAEFLGAATLTSVVLAVSKSGVGFSYFIAGGLGLAMALLVLVVGSASAAHYNPAVTVGLWTVRKIRTLDAVVYLAAQFLGAVAAWRLVVYLTDQSLKNIAGRTFDWRVLVAEGLGALVLTLGVSAATYKGLKGLEWAAAVGGALFLGVLVASLASNGLINPAVALGVQSWSKAYVVGPLLGGVVGANLYYWVFVDRPARKPRAAVASRRTTTSTRARAKKPTARSRRRK